MKVIWKAKFQPNSVRAGQYEVSINAPAGARPISVASLSGDPSVWFECEGEVPRDQWESFTLYCVGTGFGCVPEGKRFLGTILQGAFVWHIYCDQKGGGK